jgi:glycosyltransferase involved in cell wall biosynthesis
MVSGMSKPIRILRIIARLNIGGPSIHVTLLTQKLVPPHYESILICGTLPPGEGDMGYFAEARGVKPVVVPEIGRNVNPIRDLITIWKLYWMIRRLKPDIVHTHTAKAGFTGRVAAWLAGVPVIIHTFHGHVFQGYFSPALTQVFIWLERLTARMSDTVIVLTEGLRRELAEQYRITRKRHMTVLPLGLDLDVFTRCPRHTGEFRRQYAIPSNAPLVGIIGRLAPVKNHGLFLDAVARVHAEIPEAVFVIVGDGENAIREEIKAKIAALGLTDVVKMTGWVQDVAPIYSDLDVLVISSLNEGTPVTVIEALASRCPVVATAVGGLPDLLDRGALGAMVPSGDADALAKAIAQTLRTPPTNSAQAQKLMVDRYGIDRLVRDLDSLYRGLLAKKRGTSDK